MEDNANTNINADSTVEEIIVESKRTEEKNEEVTRLNDDAGPSRIPLPGAVQTVKSNIQTKPGLSKSEHNLRHIITTKDVTNALKSLSFGPTAQIPKSLNLNEIKVNLVEEEVEGRTDSATLIDLKKFMASCFKFNKDASNAMLLAEIPNTNVQNVRPVIASVANETQGASNNVQPENISTKNEVLITTHESKLSKGEKKKTSGTLSERSDLAVTQRDSLSSIGSNVCRICMTRGKERLISPCNCKGSLANVHLTCLERWLNQVGRNHCELCGFSYPAIRTPRYTVLQALRLWFGNPRNRSHLQSDCLIFWLLSTVTAGLLAVCIVGTQYFVMEGSNFGKLDPSSRKEEGISHRITETAMDFFMAIVLCGYSVTVYLLWKDHYVMWNRWRRANVNVRLLLSPDANPVPFVPRNRYNVV